MTTPKTKRPLNGLEILIIVLVLTGAGYGTLYSYEAWSNRAVYCLEPGSSQAQKFEELFQEWGDIWSVAMNTPNFQLSERMREIQTVRQAFSRAPWNPCIQPVVQEIETLMDDSVEILASADESASSLQYRTEQLAERLIQARIHVESAQRKMPPKELAEQIAPLGAVE